ncbi:hypothetical protein ACFDR9_005655 [Janthinobacterium sp. CG_23.3]|uniref:IS4 family transposase n=1 Tax=Janthinobacterium sp. CG_23.3 TaxID=3349634 RepID=UPI0038D43FF3
MSSTILSTLFAAFAQHLQSPQFRDHARHADHPRAFCRNRKLPLHCLIAAMLTGMRKSTQAELDEFFGHLHQQAQLLREVTAQAFSKARAKLSGTALTSLNDWLIERAERDGYIPRWHGLRLVAADASVLRFGLRASHVPRAAAVDQIAFGLFLPGAEMMLAAALHSTHENERQMLYEQLGRLSPTDLLLLDRGYPCRWLPVVLGERGIAFCMRVEHTKSPDSNEHAEKSGFACVRQFLRSGATDQIVTLRAPDRADATDYECAAAGQTVRLVRHVAPNGKIRVLMTNLLDSAAFPAHWFGDLYHQRWRIEEAFKRLKHRLNLEHVSGLSHLAVMQDVAAKVLCDNLQALTTLTARADANLPASTRINRAYVHTALKPLLPALLLGRRGAAKLLLTLLKLVARNTYRHKEGLSKPRKSRPKPHKHMTLKPC